MISTKIHTFDPSLLCPYPFTPHTTWLALPIRMFSSSILTFLPDIPCYLTFRPNNQSLQPHSCSVRWPHHSEKHSISHCCVTTHSHHIRHDLSLYWCVHTIVFFALVHHRHCYHSPPFPHTCLFVLEIFPIFFYTTSRWHTHVLFTVWNTCIIINAYISICLNLIVYFIFITPSRFSYTHDHITHEQRHRTFLKMTDLCSVITFIILQTTPYHITHRCYINLFTPSPPFFTCLLNTTTTVFFLSPTS